MRGNYSLKMSISPNLFLFLEPQKKTKCDIDKKWCKFRILHVSWKNLQLQKKTDQALHWSLVSYYTACAQMLFDKDIMIKRHMDIYADLSESPLFVYQSRKHKQWGLWSSYTSVTCDQWYISQIILQKLKKNAANKIHLSHLNASMSKNEMTYS